MRLLLIAERAEFRLLVRKHVEIEWPDVVIVEHRLGEEPAIDPDFAATGFDAAIIIAGSKPGLAEPLIAELQSRPEFAPLVVISLQEAPEKEETKPGLYRLYGRKLDRGRLKFVLTHAAQEHKRTVAARRSNPNFEQRYRFGSIMIRGHRCIRQIGSGGMCKIYLAESERAGTLVVLKVFNQVPDVSERIIGFDRFLQEYQIVANLKHRNIVRIYDLAWPTIMPTSRWNTSRQVICGNV